MINRLVNALLPSLCLLCDQPLDAANASVAAPAQLCRYCADALPWNDPCCPRCATPLRLADGRDPASASHCSSCLEDPPAFHRAIAPLRFETVVQRWLHQLKFHHGVVEGRVLGEILGAAVAQNYPASTLPEVIVPVPLSRRRLARRGHNQALTIATAVARRLGLPVARLAVRRTLHTQPQTARTRSQRARNVAGAFVSKPWRGTRVAVVDDVMTTGATATQVARALLDAGATDVHLWVTARTPPPW